MRTSSNRSATGAATAGAHRAKTTPAASASTGARQLPHGYDHKYIYTHLGYNLKATDMQAAVGISQMKASWTGSSPAGGRTSRQLPEVCSRARRALSATAGDAERDPSWFGFLMTMREVRRSTTAVVRTWKNNKIGDAAAVCRQPDASAGVLGRRVPRRRRPSTNTDKVMNDAFWIGVWPGIGDAERNYIVSTFTGMVRHVAR